MVWMQAEALMAAGSIEDAKRGVKPTLRYGCSYFRKLDADERLALGFIKE